MCRLHHETNKGAPLCGWPEDTHPGQFSQTFHRITSKVRIVFKNCCASDLLDVIDGRFQPDGPGDIWCAGLKSVRRLLECAFFQGHADDHLAAAMPRRHRIENFGAPVERSDASRSTHLVSGESQEITAQLLHID